MKVLFTSRPDLFTVFGGDSVQVLQTQKALEALGVQIDVTVEQFPSVAGYDLVHIFNTQFAYFGHPQLEHVKRHGCRVALSTIHWNMRPALQSPDFLGLEVREPFGKLLHRTPRISGRALSIGRDLLTGYRAKIASMLKAADVLLPNSVAELEIVVQDFGYPMARSKAFIVVNAVREGFAADASPSAKSAEVLSGLPDEFVMEAARVESVKGQLPLLRASARLCPELPLVFVGGHRPGRYWDEFERLRRQRDNVYYVDVVPHEDLPAFYNRARVHVLPSFRESPGLSTLEAALCGANCVVGIEAPIQEYFGSDAWVCDPRQESSIAQAIINAWHSPRSGALGKRVAQFTWERVAKETLAAYEFALRS